MRVTGVLRRPIRWESADTQLFIFMLCQTNCEPPTGSSRAPYYCECKPLTEWCNPTEPFWCSQLVDTTFTSLSTDSKVCRSRHKIPFLSRPRCVETPYSGRANPVVLDGRYMLVAQDSAQVKKNQPFLIIHYWIRTDIGKPVFMNDLKIYCLFPGECWSEVQDLTCRSVTKTLQYLNKNI